MFEGIDRPLKNEHAFVKTSKMCFVDVQRGGDGGRVPLAREFIPIPVRKVRQTHPNRNAAFVALCLRIISIRNYLAYRAQFGLRVGRVRPCSVSGEFG
jgi:hypothetical protein